MATGPDVDWVEQHFRLGGGFPRPDWEAIGARIERTVPGALRNETWDAAAQLWLHRTAEGLGTGYRVLKSRNFLLLAPALDGHEETLLRFLEHALRTVMDSLPGVASDEGYGRHAVLVLKSDDLYYSYVDWFHPPGGAYPFTGGMCLRPGYTHFVVAWHDLAHAERTVAHELAHGCLGHLDIPQWLDEGIADVMKNIAVRGSKQVPSAEMLGHLRDYWNAETIQPFWSGDSFHRPIDGFELGYTLGYLAVKSLSSDFPRFRKFVLRARYEDGGESAYREVFGGSLGDVLVPLLGPGDWRPRPETWTGADDDPRREEE